MCYFSQASDKGSHRYGDEAYPLDMTGQLGTPAFPVLVSPAVQGSKGPQGEMRAIAVNAQSHSSHPIEYGVPGILVPLCVTVYARIRTSISIHSAEPLLHPASLLESSPMKIRPR